MALTDKQRGVLKGVISGAVITAVVLAAAIAISPVSLSPEALVSERIAFALKADLVLALYLAFSVGRLGRHRFFTPEDIDGGGLTHGTDQANVLQSILQNTLEQTVLAVLVHTTWAATMPLSWSSAVPAAVIMFLCGRVLFARGYSGGAPSRALGFALTFYPTVLMLVVITIKVVYELVV